jgi:hypothetical protein
MRFQAKFDTWIVASLILAALVTVVLPLAAMIAAGAHRPPPLAVVIWVLWAVALASTLPQYYEVREDGLFIRQGWRRILVPYASLVEVRRASDTRSAAVWSTHRVLVAVQTGRPYIIAPAEQKRFLDEIAKRAPQLERRGSGLRLPASPPAPV